MGNKTKGVPVAKVEAGRKGVCKAGPNTILTASAEKSPLSNPKFELCALPSPSFHKTSGCGDLMVKLETAPVLPGRF